MSVRQGPKDHASGQVWRSQDGEREKLAAVQARQRPHQCPASCVANKVLDSCPESDTGSSLRPHSGQRDWNVGFRFSHSPKSSRHVKEGVSSSRTEKAM